MSNLTGKRAEINEFIIYNSSLISEMNKVAPEIGNAFSLVIRELEKRHGEKLTPSFIIGTPIKFGNIEVAEFDIPGELSWDEAKNGTEKFSDGWRLPTDIELFAIYAKKQDFPNLINSNYWTSIENANNTAICYDFKDGSKLWFYDKAEKCNVRLVKDYKVNTDNIIIGSLAIATNDLSIKMNWKDANEAVKNYGQGWRLPTKDELNTMYINKAYIGNFDQMYYWSSTEASDSKAWIMNLESGMQFPDGKTLPNYVRAVKDVQTTKTTPVIEEIKEGDIVEWKDLSNKYSAKKGAKAKVRSVDDVNDRYDVEWLDKLSNNQNNGGYPQDLFIKSELKPTKIKTFSQVETFPTGYAIDPNIGDRPSPSQSSSKWAFNDTPDLYVRGNDGNWYSTQQDRNRIYRWQKMPNDPYGYKPTTTVITKKETDPKDLVGKNIQWNISKRTYKVVKLKRNSPKNKSYELTCISDNITPDTEGSFTIQTIEKLLNGESVGGFKIVKDNTDYSTFTQDELLSQKTQLIDALSYLDEEDDEYKEIKTKIETIDLFID